MPKQKTTVNKRTLGSQYESLAKQYLVGKGYEILATNYRCRCGEIDLVAKEHEYIVFIEVKYRRTLRFGYPGEAVTYTKRQHIIRTAQYYMKTVIGYEAKCRFDVIGILDHQVTHIKAAF